MARVNVATVDAYIDLQPADVRGALLRIRQAIRAAVPLADESISYGMPTYKQDGRPIVYFAGWARHCSLYPATSAVKAAVGPLEAPLELEKGTLRIPYSIDVPVRLVARFAAERAGEVCGRSRKQSASTTSAKGRVRDARTSPGSRPPRASSAATRRQR